jgi:hypothetical protein
MREMELQPYSEFVPFGTNLADIPEESFQQLLSNSKTLLQLKIDKEEKERIENEERIRKEQIERERVRIENEQLRAEAFEKEKLIAGLQTANQDLKFQLIQLHREIYGTEH